MKKYLYLSIAILATLMYSCSEADSMDPSQEVVNNLPKHTVNVSLSGTFTNAEEGDLRAYMTPTPKDEIKIEFDESELMVDGNVDPVTGKTQRVKNTNTAQLTLYFVEASNLNNVVTAIVDPTDFRKNSDGSYTIEYMGSVELTGVDVTTGDWYVSGGYRLQKAEHTGGIPVGAIHVNENGQIEFYRDASNKYTDFKLPFVFGWSKLTTKTTNTTLEDNHAQQLDLKLKPDGYQLRYRAINNLVEDINLNVLHLSSNGLSLNAGPFDYTNPSTDNLTATNTPRISTNITAANSGRNATVGIFPTDAEINPYDWGTGRVLASGDYFTNFLRLNTPTTPKTTTGALLRFQFGTLHFPQGQTARGVSLDSRDIEGMPTPSITNFYKNIKYCPLQPSGYIVDMWRGASQQDYTGWDGGAPHTTRSYRDMYLPENLELTQKGSVNNVNFKINSDLMITELYTSTYTTRSGSFGLIEIYNPTLDPIDISKYGLMRFGYRKSGSDFVVRTLPSTNELIVNNNIGNTIFDNMSSALVLPLDLKSGEPSGDWTVNSFNRTIKQIPVKSTQYMYSTSVQYNTFEDGNTIHSNFGAKVVDYSTKNYITGLKTITPGKTYIEPGKTMIILFSGYASDSYTPNDEDLKIFAKIQQAVNAGYCDYVVALSHGSTTAQPHEAMAGVTTADLGDAFSLVRIVNLRNAHRYENITDYTRTKTRIFIDGTWNSLQFDGNGVIRNLIDGGATALIRRPYGPYLWNIGFQDPNDPSRYYQKAYDITKATFGVPYFTSYDAAWNDVVKPKIVNRDANLFRK